MSRAQEALARRRARGRRDRWARTFRPTEVRLLLVAEAPPSALDRYFYFPVVSTQDSLFREVAWAVLSIAPTRENKRQLLEKLQAEGVFMIDAVLEPISGRYTIDVARLVARIRRLNPDRVVIVKAGVFDRIYAPLLDAQIPVVPVRIPFPGSGQQVRFREAFTRARRHRISALISRKGERP